MPSVRPSSPPHAPAATRPCRRGRCRPRTSSVARIVPCALGLLLLAGCAAPSLRTEVTRFNEWTGAEPRTVAFRRDPPPDRTLEHRSYERSLGSLLAASGFTVADAASARYQVAFTYQASAEPRRITEYWQPGGYGAGYPFGPGPWYGPSLLYPYPYGRFDPLWSFPPVPIARDITVWRHEVKVDLFDMRDAPPEGRKVYESRAIAYAEYESLPRMVPALLEAAMAGFPGQSGETRRVEIPLPGPPAR
jgi:hypothetical protein